MNYLNIKVPGDELNVSKIVLGTDYFGTSVPQETAFELLDYYVEVGGNCIDTARFYADWMPGGHEASEKTLGAWLKSSQARDKVLISTKGGHPLHERMNESRLSRECIEGDLHKSLTTLGIERLISTGCIGMIPSGLSVKSWKPLEPSSQLARCGLSAAATGRSNGLPKPMRMRWRTGFPGFV
jgi:hypothetical protein